MPDHKLIVLKFGGSVLADADALPDIVKEIIRWREDNRHVVAIVSAFAGRTEQLLARCDRAHQPSPYTTAAVAAIGEYESAALLTLALNTAAIPSETFTPPALRLLAHGPPLDAAPQSVDRAVIRLALARSGVVVIPGFIATDDHSRTVTLGRGGSDISALFLARELQAETCRLIKDVDGLYERDPAGPLPKPKRYTSATFGDALATDGSIIQHKAVRFAREHNLRFELTSLASDNPTTIGADATYPAEQARRIRSQLIAP